MPKIEPFDPVKELLGFGNYGLVGKCDRDRLIQIARWLETKLEDHEALIQAFPVLGGDPDRPATVRKPYGFAVVVDGYEMTQYHPTREEAILAYARKLPRKP